MNDPADWGFHPGELAVQRRAGVTAQAARLVPMLEPADLSGGFARFLASRTFAVISARDADERLWASPLAGPPGFLAATAPTEVLIEAAFAPGDPLRALPAWQPAGLITVEFAARRRLRLNGMLTGVSPGRLAVEVDQAFGNCPQYIHPRTLELGGPSGPSGPETEPGTVREGTSFDPADVELIQAADTFFLGTAHPERGSDASHKGGAPGFVRVAGNQLWWPDYAGNNMFNSFGNLAVSPGAALLFIDFGTGRTLHLSGTATIEWGQPDGSGDDGGTGRRVRFDLERLVSRPWRTVPAAA